MLRVHWPAGALLLGGLLLFALSNGRWIVPVAAWIAPVLLLRFVRDGGPRRLLVLLLCQVAVAHVMLWGIVPTLLGPLTYGLIAYYGLLWWAPYAVDRWLAQSGRPVATLVFPAAAVVVEFANAAAFGSWGAVAYSQMGNLPLVQVASVSGMWGVTFLVMWLAPVVNGAWEDRRWTPVAWTYGLVLIATLVLGGLRLARVFDHPTIPVAGITYESLLDSHRAARAAAGYSSNVAMAVDDRALASRMSRAMADSLLALSRERLAAGNRLVVWPEGGIDVLQEDEAEFLRQAGDAARAGGGDLLLAYRMLREDDPSQLAENKAVFIDATGTIRDGFIKRHPVPGSTDLAGDRGPAIIERGDVHYAVAICYDLDFPDYSRVAADIMLDPSWDWRAIDPLHTRMAMMRAVENGYSLVRITGMGLSVAVDPFGRTLAAVDYFQDGDATLVASVPTRGVPTLYRFAGDWFAWLCVAGLLGRLALYRRRG